ncbi:hypothetical protein PCANC_23790 [Puccinia coronata f. sp. avenae]|uniref:Uncharacterized protein n=1 Tax=Puccinia coronata f. sp. avenae TaxID=200324 RepID=A0A2N5TLC8_9BASI|nr:hypothetical protein PCANC_23790 [Puccinia coronata f. sp. avenae]
MAPVKPGTCLYLGTRCFFGQNQTPAPAPASAEAAGADALRASAGRNLGEAPLGQWEPVQWALLTQLGASMEAPNRRST